jgi:hypothetical protein
VKANMLIHQNPRQITECTGEAVTALAMLKTFPAAKMCWACIVTPAQASTRYGNAAMGSPTTYYIVEAKGVGATLTYKTHGPPSEIKQQMSLGWVLDNLIRMKRNNRKVQRKY